MRRVTAEKSDAELLALYGEGDEEAFRELVNRYKNSLYAFLRNFINQQDLLEDVFQETFLQLFNSRETFDDTKPLKPWLFTIAANKAKDALRKQQRKSAITIGSLGDSDEMSFEDSLSSIMSVSTTPYDNISTEETAERVRAIIVKMSKDLREILILAYFNKFSYKQMADILRIPIGTVKSRLHTAIARFAKEWKTGGSK